MKTTVVVSALGIVLLGSCAGNIQVSQSPAIEPPVEKAQSYNYNYNHAKAIVSYTTKKKKARQRISEHNRQVQNENWFRLNSGRKNPDNRYLTGSFRFYKNN